MSREERLLLLQLILEDIRGNWGWKLEDRVDEAMDLAVELDLKEHINAINEFKEDMKDGYVDGRHFRMYYTDGGYIGMKEMHGLESTIIDKSDEFKSRVYIFTYPENRLEDWEEYQESL